MGTLRFALALVVLFAHTGGVRWNLMLPGPMALQWFFIMSGFYMSLVLREKYVHHPRPLQLFLTNRLLRIFPVYWLLLVLALAFAIFLEMRPAPAEVTASALSFFRHYYGQMDWGAMAWLIWVNVGLVFQDSVLFLGLDPATGSLFFTPQFQTTNPALYRFLFIPQAWSISLELVFYLLAPFLLLRGWRVVLLVLLGSVLLRVVLIGEGLFRDPWAYRFLPTELALFLLGYFSYLLYGRVRHWRIPPSVSLLLWIVSLAAASASFRDAPIGRCGCSPISAWPL